MTHPSEGMLQALLDGELPQEDQIELERHLHVCTTCEVEYASLRDSAEQISQVLRLLDRPAPVEMAQRRVARRRPGPSTWGVVALRRAAILVLFTSAALSATIPGSPVRSWLEGAWGNDAGNLQLAAEADQRDAAPAVAAAEAAAEDPAPSGISVRPADGQMRVVLSTPAPGLRIHVRLHEGERVGVWASGAAAEARFRTTQERIEVTAPGSGDLRIEIPQSARRFVLEVNGRVYLAKEGENLRFPGPAADTSGMEILFEVQP